MKKLKAFTVFFAVALSAVLSAFAAPGDLPVHLALDDVPPEDIVSIGSAAEWDAFAAMYAGDIDLDGNPRVQGSSIDFGCYESPASTSGYPYWAWRWGLGAWNEKGADGIHNVFRYAFDKPVGAFADPPLLGISFDEQGRAVIKTPPLVNGTGFDLSILATDAPDAPLSGGTAYPIDRSGSTTIDETDKPARFFRLRATEAE